MDVSWDEAGFRELVKGPIMADLRMRAIRVETAAKQYATGRPGPNVKTGRLRQSITWQEGEDSTSPYVDIGSNVTYAIYVEEGHNVVRGGRVVGRAPAYPYLRPALSAANT
jgi:hypothetical protein